MLVDTARRRASVGCAVKTGWKRRPAGAERGVVADLGRQAHEGRGDRVGGILLVGPPVALAQHAHALVLLGEVHEVEVDREGRATSSAR
jgi:hypothetical protein